MNTCKNYKIKSIKAREVLDSRGSWTIEIELETDQGIFTDSAPSGASTGKYEAKTVAPEIAVKNANSKVAKALRGKNVLDQKGTDEILESLNVGANTTTAVSAAVCRAGAAAKNILLYRYIRELYTGRFTRHPMSGKLPDIGCRVALTLPRPCFNMVNGGAHASNNLDFQEFMAVPQFKEYSKNLKLASEIYQDLRKKLGKNVGDEGGFAPLNMTVEQVLDLLCHENVKIAIDVAASQFYKNGKYCLQSGVFDSGELAEYYRSLIKKYPIVSLEDPFAEDDEAGWKTLDYKILKIGDDLLVTNPEKIKRAKEKDLCNGLLLKVNQIGTVSGALEAARLAKSYGWKIMVSHRSGETNDDFIADLAVGIGADYIKAGAPARGERVAKYNRLLRIEEEVHPVK